ncbi:FAD binding domain-containing protein [Sulfitobacter aestuarii]|uniref:FAD binding domain-containing protein n=1 Tax=Sulfitobacter aestuarii TaxID=2161676 RepID=A0ABW5TWI3_9RHOB
MSYVVATDLQQALNALAADPVSLIAGGTDWFPAQGHRPFKGRLLDLTRVAALRGITRQDNCWRFGATTTWSDVIRADLPPAFSALQQAAREVGSVQIQNTGTLAGNLCNASPAADGVPPLLMLDAEVELTSLTGQRRMKVTEFLLGVRQTARRPDELLSAIHVLAPPERAQSAFVKLGARKYLVISICMISALVVVEQGHISDARVAVGAASPVAQRMTALEQALEGLPVAEVAAAIRSAHFKGLTPISDIRATAEYRREALMTATSRALAQAIERSL